MHRCHNRSKPQSPAADSHSSRPSSKACSAFCSRTSQTLTPASSRSWFRLENPASASRPSSHPARSPGPAHPSSQNRSSQHLPSQSPFRCPAKHKEKGPLAVSALAGLSEVLSKRSLLRHTGHSRQHALRMMMVMPVMVLHEIHLHFSLTFTPA